MNYAVVMVSGAMIYISSFIKTGSGIQKLRGDSQTQNGDLMCLLLFFLNKKNRLKINCLNMKFI
jgi:hypothetical protein